MPRAVAGESPEKRVEIGGDVQVMRKLTRIDARPQWSSFLMIFLAILMDFLRHQGWRRGWDEAL